MIDSSEFIETFVESDKKEVWLKKTRFA